LLTATVRTVDDIIAGDAPLLPAAFEGRPAYFFVDSGSAVSLAPLSTLVDFDVLAPVRPSKWCVRAASGTSLKVMGEVKLDITLSGKTYSFPFVVVDDAHLPGDLLLGYNFMHKAEIHQQPDRDTVTHQGNVYRLTTPSSVWHSSSNSANIAAATTLSQLPAVDPTPDDSSKDYQTRRSSFATNAGSSESLQYHFDDTERQVFHSNRFLLILLGAPDGHARLHCLLKSHASPFHRLDGSRACHIYGWDGV